MARYDVVVVGGGHNGLVAAAYLTKAGREVVVVEKRDTLGGLAGTYELAPGFRASVGPDFAGLLSPQVIAVLELERHGLEILPLDPVVSMPEGLSLWRDVEKSVAEIRKHSLRDAEAYPRFVALVETLASFLRPLLSRPAPTPDIRGGSDLLGLVRLGWGFRQLGARPMHELLRILPMSVSDFLDEWFENEPLKAALAGRALEGICLGPKAAGTAALFLYHRLGDDPALAKNLVSSMEAVVREHGGEIRIGEGVTAILVDDGRVRGVSLENGETIEATRVLSTVSPRRTFLELVEPTRLEPHFVHEIDHIRYRGVTAKLDLALDALPEGYRGGVVHVGPSLDHLERAYDAAKYGRASDEPFLRAVVPSAVDSSRAPEGKHVMSVLVQYVPLGTTISAEKVMSALGVDGSVLHHHLFTPSDYANELGLPDGNLHHGEMALDQMFFMRPVPGWSHHRTPVEGLFFGGAGAHPGGSTTGAPGRNAAIALLKHHG